LTQTLSDAPLAARAKNGTKLKAFKDFRAPLLTVEPERAIFPII